VKHLVLALAISAAGWPLSALAHRAELQEFRQSPRDSSEFVLGSPARSDVLHEAHSNQVSDLATEFADFGAPESGSAPLAPPPPNRTIRVPAWMQRPKVTLRAEEQAAPTAVWASASEENCPAATYAPNPSLAAAAERRRATWYRAMAKVACDAGVPVSLFDAVLIQESRYNPAALSPKGASGLAQLMPASARRLGVRNLWDPIENMRGGARYLRLLLDEFGRFDLALAAYNAGPGRVRETGRVPRITETINYVSGILMTMRNQFTRAGGLGVGQSDQSAPKALAGAVMQRF